MKIMFVGFGAENLGVEQISALLKSKGHKVELVFDPMLFDDKIFMKIKSLNSIFKQDEKLLKEIQLSAPDLLAFSILTYTYQKACALAKRVKEKLNVPIIFGGVHATIMPERVIKNSFVDMVCVGEGEYPMLELAESLSEGSINNKIQNIWFKQNNNIIKNPIRRRILNLDALPFFDKALFESAISYKDIYTTITSRGCVFNCSFCCVSKLNEIYKNQPSVCRRSGEKVLQELMTMKKRYSFKKVVFEDDIFAFDKSWLRKFLTEYKKYIDIPYTCQGHVNYFDIEIGHMLKESKCQRIIFGIQSMNEDSRERILNRFTSNKNITNSLEICEKIDLDFHIHHILGIPFEEENDLVKAAGFYNKFSNCKRISSFHYASLPKTRLTSFLAEKGLIDDNELEEIAEGKLGVFQCGGGSILKDKPLFKRAKNFEILFYMIPFCPDRVINFIIDKKIYKFFNFFYSPLRYLLNMLIGIRGKDYRFIIYAKYYIRQIIKSIK